MRPPVVSWHMSEAVGEKVCVTVRGGLGQACEQLRVPMIEGVRDPECPQVLCVPVNEYD